MGEARVRAFLLERFWVLQRSVDVDGADHVEDSVSSALYDLEEARDALQAILEGDDPTKREELLESRAIADFRSPGHGTYVEIGFSLGDVFDEDAFRAARDHKERVERLRSAGLLDAFVTLHATVDEEVQKKLRQLGRRPTERPGDGRSATTPRRSRS